MFAVAVPMWVLYFGALGVCAVVDRRRRQREEAA
jgi:Sec-independent protein secretion pathway component TatC